MSYTTYDFHETLFNPSVRGEIDPAAVEKVIAAWGRNPEGYGSWEGGFLLALKDGRFAYVTGWCDTTGWGCQDGASVTYFDQQPALSDLERPEVRQHDYEPVSDWDLEPADLNQHVANGYQGATYE